jgi:hypothetical protein
VAAALEGPTIVVFEDMRDLGPLLASIPLNT